MDDPVQLKVTLSGDVSPTVSRLRLRHARRRKIWFLEDLAERSSGVDLPLLAAGMILHLRSRDDESTVKLRPCRRERLVGEWTGSHRKGKGRDGDEFRIEWEWAGSTVSYLHPPSRGSTMTSFSESLQAQQHRRSLKPRSPARAPIWRSAIPSTCRGGQHDQP